MPPKLRNKKLLLLRPEHRPCLLTSEVNCASQIKSDYKHACKEKCPTECNSIRFAYTPSFIDYLTPAKYTELAKRNHATMRTLNQEQVKQSVLKLNIFYDSLEYEYITEKPKMNLVDLLANIGGTLGLCLGISVLSFIEIFEIFTRIFLVALH